MHPSTVTGNKTSIRASFLASMRPPGADQPEAVVISTDRPKASATSRKCNQFPYTGRKWGPYTWLSLWRRWPEAATNDRR